MRRVILTSRFEKDVRRLKKRHYDALLLSDVMKKLARGEVLAEQFRDHPLRGNYYGTRECHLAPDWLLIYRLIEDIEIEMIRTGTHADLFE
jgi:mRNA interferase YafQ